MRFKVGETVKVTRDIDGLHTENKVGKVAKVVTDSHPRCRIVFNEEESLGCNRGIYKHQGGWWVRVPYITKAYNKFIYMGKEYA